MFRKIDELEKHLVYGEVEFLTLIENAKPYYRGGTKYWGPVAVCRCLKCRKTFEANPYEVRDGKVKSCGCDRYGKSTLRHGLTGTRTHNIWMEMLKRCNQKHNKNYGGRGVKVAKRWHIFENFLADMGMCPDGFSIERKDTSKGYCKSNCLWIPLRSQPKNRRDTLKLEYKGKKYNCLKDFCRDYNIGYAYARNHIFLLNKPIDEVIKSYKKIKGRTGFKEDKRGKNDDGK